MVEHSNRIEAIQKRAFRIIFGSFDYLDFCSRNGLSTLYERRDLLARQYFQSILNKRSCLNYLLPEERSDRVIGKLRHPSIFKLPHVHTTRCVFVYFTFNPAFGLQLSLIKLSI